MRNRLEYIPLICIAGFVRVLPRSWALDLGKWLGQLAPYFQGKRVNIARDNLQRAFPEMPPEEASETISAMFKHMGISFIDMLRLDK